MYFNQDSAISLNGKPLNLVHFTYLGSNISLTESSVSKLHIDKAWTAIYWLLT